MDEKNMIQNFGDMVSASERLVRPWKTLAGFLLTALVVTNAIWGFVLFKQIQYAYLTPTELEQEQLFDKNEQSQKYSNGVTYSD